MKSAIVAASACRHAGCSMVAQQGDHDEDQNEPPSWQEPQVGAEAQEAFNNF
jgi:hypothetical protein